jgi:cell wall-associated NlpC family hydrolase
MEVAMMMLLLFGALLVPGSVAAQMQISLAPFISQGRYATMPRLAPGIDVASTIRLSTRSVQTADPARLKIATVISAAEQHLGVRYRYGGSTPSGFDCSGFVRYVFAGVGIALPGSARRIARVGTRVDADPTALVPGDLVFLNVKGRGIDHVAIYAGNGRVIHATSKGGGVRYDHIMSERGRWVVRHLVSARRVVQGQTSGKKT